MSSMAQQAKKSPTSRPWQAGIDILTKLPKTVWVSGAALLIALVAVVAIWSRGPEYRVLFSNISEQDGGAIVNTLTQMNVPYRFSDGGSALLVPADKVYETRLQLASRGLPKGGAAGFELLDNERFGASQFTQQVNYQRGLEGELSRSIEALQAVQHARVHLALPRQSLFLRERQKPSASVLLTLHPGRSLGDGQVAAISWLVSSSVSDLPAENVSIVDQAGRLLSAGNGKSGLTGDPQQITRDVEQRAMERILTLISPIVGPGNVLAQVSADLDFTQREETSEAYKPNQEPGQAAIRSRQTSNSSQNGGTGAIGIPGALSNQPPVTPTAPIVQPPATNTNTANAPTANPAATTQANAANTPQTPSQQRSDDTVNYEIDRTISHVKRPTGSVRKLSVAVVINYRSDADGNPQPVSAEEMGKIEKLIREAVGYDESRGDTVSVANSPFTESVAEKTPIWQDPVYIDLTKTILQYLALAIIALLAWRGIVRPIAAQRKADRENQIKQASDSRLADRERNQNNERIAQEKQTYESNLAAARDLSQKDPRAVAMIVRSWMTDGHNT